MKQVGILVRKIDGIGYKVDMLRDKVERLIEILGGEKIGKKET